jgi:hypothetical protein
MSLYVGIDVSKAALDVAFGSDGDVVRVANNENGIGELVGQVVKAGPRRSSCWRRQAGTNTWWRRPWRERKCP